MTSLAKISERFSSIRSAARRPSRLPNALSFLVQIFAMLLPHPIKRFLLRSVLGWSIGENTRIGCSIILCGRVSIGANCQIGHFNLFRDLKTLEIGNETKILNLNHFMASKEKDWPDAFSIKNNSQITSRHFFDCSGGIRIGNLCLIGGRDSQFWTHFYDSRDGIGRIKWHELTVADRCYVCARSTLVYCKIPADSVVGAGAVVTEDFSKEGTGLLLAGNPAQIKRRFIASLPAKPDDAPDFNDYDDARLS
jgi:carbonic anhydrase/acetyltransferase-like protein (isoleucine patch superfamily)